MIAVLLLASCSGPPVKEAEQTLRAKAICCETFATVQFQNLPIRERVKVSLSAESPVMRFLDDRSYFVAFALPAGAEKLTIESTIDAGITGMLQYATYIRPVVQFLDGQKNALGAEQHLKLSPGHRTIFFNIGEDYFGDALAVPEGARFVVLRPDPKNTDIQYTASENGTVWPVRPVGIGAFNIIAQ